MIHYRKTFATYPFFTSSIIGLRPELEGVRAFGTDGEESLVKAFSDSFSFGLHLTCFIHMRRNIKRHLSDRGLDASSQNQILDDIFGRQVGWLIVPVLQSSEISSMVASLFGTLSREMLRDVLTDSMNGLLTHWGRIKFLRKRLRALRALRDCIP